MKKVAVVLFSLGGPDSKEAIFPYLYNFFNDPKIIPLPDIIRKFVASGIARKRSCNEADKIYAELGYRSPLLENTEAFGKELSEKLKIERENIRFGVFVCMRYWHPRASEVVEKVSSFGPDYIVLLPMYPQFSTVTTGSSLEEWRDHVKLSKIEAKESCVCCYPVNSGFIGASVDNIKKAYDFVKEKSLARPKLILSAHGLPEYLIKKGDPYQFQCEQTADEIISKLELENNDWVLGYQSRVGPMKWTGPDTKDEIIKASGEGRPIIIYPISFVSDHAETLVEIDIEYKEIAENSGCPCFIRAAVAGNSSRFVDGIKDLVLQSMEDPDEFLNVEDQEE